MDPARIESWHAHVYFDAASRDAAWALRETIAATLGTRAPLGRFHERPVGPHPMWSYQLSIAPDQFTHVVGWLALNHGALDVFIHPNTGDQLRQVMSRRGKSGLKILPFDFDTAAGCALRRQVAKHDELGSAVVYRMEQHGVIAMPVVDERERAIGVVHLHDLMRAGVA